LLKNRRKNSRQIHLKWKYKILKIRITVLSELLKIVLLISSLCQTRQIAVFLRLDSLIGNSLISERDIREDFTVKKEAVKNIDGL